ncbi:hypothetical protein [Actinomadura rupiterrae]|uniref:hypothetical protein n=1 Tax=Actinomadura rupiterrae TaxID=559627 RepID=UPI0020A2E32F|nr:hypothetical protein [Actinomadura rupiterrae]MCP2338718.1 hypothetical protein [Actinomadura rupiterrae]
MPSPRLLTTTFATLATLLAALGLGFSVHSVLASDGLWWELGSGHRGAEVPLALALVFGAAVVAVVARRTTSAALLCIAPALAQLVHLATSWSWPGDGHGHAHGEVRYLYRYPLGELNMAAYNGGPSWSEMSTMAAIGAGLLAAMAGVFSASTRNRPRLLLVALPGLAGMAIGANYAAQRLSALHREMGWWGIWQHAATMLIAVALGAALLLFARVRRLAGVRAAALGGAGALLLLMPLAQELWDNRPTFIARSTGGNPSMGGWFASGPIVRDKWNGIAEVIASLGATTLQLTIVLAALAGLACAWPERQGPSSR